MKQREIKFRVWDGKEMQYDIVGIWDDAYCCNIKDDVWFTGILMQYIGLKDKNDNDIFEGDIVKHLNGIKEVTYNESQYAFSMDVSSVVCDQEAGCINSSSVVVIGNIYENPNLRQ